MKKLIFGLLTLTALGVSSVPAHAGDASTEVTSDNATIQEVNMTVDQMGNNNGATMSGTVRNSTSGRRTGSNGSVQRGTSTIMQTGEGNEASTDFTIENYTRYGKDKKPAKATVEH